MIQEVVDTEDNVRRCRAQQQKTWRGVSLTEEGWSLLGLSAFALFTIAAIISS